MGFLKNLLGLGVAAGTAYAAVKVAQKYNEKKNANADLNGDGAVDAKDTRSPPGLSFYQKPNLVKTHGHRKVPNRPMRP
mgnify:CR=1 FL=1